MMRKTILMLMLAAMSTGAMAEWVKHIEIGQAVMYHDPATIRKDGNLRKVWEVQDLKQRTDGAMSRRALVEYDCKEERYRILSISSHSDRMAGGYIIVSSDTTNDWEHVPPSSPAEALLKVVCRKGKWW